jgi:phosphatidylglycerophosphate synthase
LFGFVYGKYVADKLLINALSISLWIQGTIPGVLMALWLMRDVFLMVATHRYVAQNTAPGMAVMDPVTVPLKVTPTTISKVNTALQFVTLTVGIVGMVPHEMAATDVVPILLSYNDWIMVQLCMTETILPALCWTTGTTTVLSCFSYWGHSAFAAAASSKILPRTTK